MKRVVFPLACLLGIGAVFCLPGAEQTPPPAPRNTTPAAVVSRYCVTCHNSKLKTGSLVLDPAAALKAGDHPEVWERAQAAAAATCLPRARRDRMSLRTTRSLLRSRLRSTRRLRRNRIQAERTPSGA